MSLRRVSSIALCLVSFFFTVPTFAQATCKLNSTDHTITICTPADGETVSTTFHVNAGVTSSVAIQYIEVYVHYVRYAVQNRNYLDATITVPAGADQNLTVQAIDANGTWIYKTIHVTVSATDPYSISPQSPTVKEGATQQFTASAASTWSATCGSITSAGLFTAPLSQPSCTVKGTATSGGAAASTSVHISSPITITPAGATTIEGKTQQFTANESVSWSTSCGSISTSGLFTAPSTAETCTINATAASGTAYTATASDTVTSSAPPVVNYTTWKFDNARDGLNSHETILSPTNVNASNFGQVFTTAVDGFVFAQPLYMASVTIGSTAHNVVYAATENDSVYALDGSSGSVLWKESLLESGETPANGKTINSTIVPIQGITGTPVIDPSTQTLYVVSESVTSAGVYFHRLHALSLSTGAEKFGGPVVITTSGFASQQELQRPGLLLANGNVYIAFGSNGDTVPWHGYLFAYNAGTLAQVAAWNVTPGLSAGAIWMGGAGPAADSNGDIYVATANGDWNGSQVFGQSIVKLSPTLGVLDYFTPINHNSESTEDKDLGSGGVTLLPTSTGTYPHELVNCSKLNVVYVINRDHLGEIGSSSDNVVQQVTGQIGGTTGIQAGDECFSNPTYWNNNLYFMGNNDSLKQFSFNSGTGMMSTTPVFKDTFAYHFPGGQPVVSSNGNANAIVWAIDIGTSTLRAYNATNVSKVLYVSGSFGTGVKFSAPTVVQGHVYIGTSASVVGMGLVASGSSCSIPTTAGVHVCAPTQGGSYSSPVTVSAAGKAANGSVERMELWIDGAKINNYFADQFTTTVSLAVGSHQVTIVEDDTTGAFIKSPIIDITVK